MTYPMRRSKQLLTPEQSFEILASNTEGILSLVDPSGAPYGVPLNYVLDGQTLYFHCALKGRKLDCIAHSSQASFCVIDTADIVSAEFTTYFRSVIASGIVSVIHDEDKRRLALEKLAYRYNNDKTACDEAVQNGLDRCAMIAMKITDITGKEAIELVRLRKKDSLV